MRRHSLTEATQTARIVSQSRGQFLRMIALQRCRERVVALRTLARANHVVVRVPCSDAQILANGSWKHTPFPKGFAILLIRLVASDRESHVPCRPDGPHREQSLFRFAPSGERIHRPERVSRMFVVVIRRSLASRAATPAGRLQAEVLRQAPAGPSVASPNIRQI